MDANFRLKNQLVSSYSADPGLGIGMAYMVPQEGYEAYVLNQATDDDISTCDGFQALAQANTRSSVGLRFTGVAGVSCGRSEMIMPNGIGNLQKGERYCNMDYVFASAVQDVRQHTIVVGYDISCQWRKNLESRVVNKWPVKLQLGAIQTKSVIGKLHEPAHKRDGHDEFSCSLTKGVGSSDFEGQERIWAGNNQAANSTKTCGPGTRQDILDDHFAFWNYEKYVSTGRTLMRRYKSALKERNAQVEGHRGFTATIPPDVVSQWEEMCELWDNTPYPKAGVVESPFFVLGGELSEAQVRQELKASELQLINDGKAVLHVSSRPSFISMGLEMEDDQHRLRLSAKAKGTMADSDKDIAKCRSTLRNKLKIWNEVRAVYMPGLMQYLSELPEPSQPPSSKPEDAPLWLPSSLPSSKRTSICHHTLPSIEDKLRTAQCHDALDLLRQTLRIKSQMVQFKNKNMRGQREGLRSTAVIDRVNSKARGLVLKYRRARAAKVLLVGAGGWDKVLKPLEDGDVRAYSDPEGQKPKQACKGTVEMDESHLPWRGGEVAETQLGNNTENERGNNSGDTIDLRAEDCSVRAGTGESTKALSWIWIMEGGHIEADGLPAESDHTLRAEWARSRARASRSTEEVSLLWEEMRRALEFVEWKSNWWIDRRAKRSTSDPSLAKGLQSYAQEQGENQQFLLQMWKALFQQPLDDKEAKGEGSDDEDENPNIEENNIDEGDEGEDESGAIPRRNQHPHPNDDDNY